MTDFPKTAAANLTNLVREAIKDAQGEPLPFFMREPSGIAFKVPVQILGALIAAAALATGWSFFIVPLGVVPINVWVALGIITTADVFRTFMRHPAEMLVWMDQQDEFLEDPEQAARLHLVEHIGHVVRVLLLATVWATIAVIGWLVT